MLKPDTAASAVVLKVVTLRKAERIQARTTSFVDDFIALQN